MADNLEYFNTKEFKKILSKYEESAKSGHPAYMDADDLADIADYYQYNGHMEEAEQAIDLALSYNPQAVGPLLYKAREAMSLKDFDTAREYAKRIDVASIYSDYNIYDKAFEWAARSQGDNSDDFKELMARTLFGLGKFQDSERIFNELIDHNPYSVRYWNALASTQFMQEDYSSAITSSEYAIAIDPNDAESILSKANSLFNLENYEMALTYYKKYSEKMPDDEFGLMHQGTCLMNLGRLEEAICMLEKAEEVADKDSPHLPDIYQEMAFAYCDLEKPETAIYYLDKTDNLECDHINIKIIKGHIYLANKMVSEAESAFAEALSLSGSSPKVMLRIIVSFYDNHLVLASYQLLKNFLKHVDEDWKDGYSYMALCCKDLKKDDEFMEYLKLACEKNPKEARRVLGSLFPKDIKSKDYYEYMINEKKKKS